MEEDIEILEKMINRESSVYKRNRRGNKEIKFEVNSNYYKAIENLLKAYKELKEENKETVKDNFRLKNELETKRKEYQETYKDVREELKELKKENQVLQKQLNGAFDRGFIPVSKIKEKIEELREIHKERDFTNKESYYLDCYKELLGEE